MKLKKLYIFVEGNDDARFFGRVLKPLLLEKFHDVEIIQFAQMKKTKVDLFIQSIKMLKFDYVLTADKDEKYSLNRKKGILCERFELLEEQYIVIVVTEIESWYLAGLTDEKASHFGIELNDSTEPVTKEDFNILYRGKFHSRIDFMQELIKNFDIGTARRRNRSFDFFISKYT